MASVPAANDKVCIHAQIGKVPPHRNLSHKRFVGTWHADQHHLLRQPQMKQQQSLENGNNYSNAAQC
jgi:hypothetical protein